MTRSTPLFFLFIFLGSVAIADSASLNPSSPQGDSIGEPSTATSVVNANETADGKADVANVPTELQGKHVINTLQDLFSVLSQANHYFNYQSLLTYEANGFITTYQLNHWIKDNTAFEQMLFLDGPPREVFREQSMAGCNNDSPGGIWPSASPSASFASYIYEVIGEERIANRQAIIFNIQPKDESRYGYRFSVDQKTGLVLKTITYEKTKIIERLQTVSLEFIEPKAPLTAEDESAYLWRVPPIQNCQVDQFQPGWQVEWLPEGFESVGTRLTTQGEQVLIFSDGLVSISVFIKQSSQKNLTKATARHGATVLVITPIEGQSGKSVAVVGEVPTQTARRIAVSVKPL